MHSRSLRPWLIALSGLGATALVLAPWWRQREFLRDFYDYGLVMSGVGRIAGGERPYVDFVTPIQTGTFLFNGWAEKLGGGTYQAMTWGGAALIVLAFAGLALLVARRWTVSSAFLLAAGLVAMSATQHTIIWHNALGALAAVGVAWASAVAPVWRRATWPWHAVVAGLLLLGGVNKLNAQLVAFAAAVAWLVRAASRRQATVGEVVRTAVGLVIAGVVAPVWFELIWTGASFSTWWHNVVGLPFSSRAGDFGQVLHPAFYFTTLHNYYGTLMIPWLGALGVAVSAWSGMVAWRRAATATERGWAVAAALFASGAGAGLLATNYEIAWVALAAWLGLVAALWVGFSLPTEGAAFRFGVLAPVVLVGAAAWQSAWSGQRSQFGYSSAPRSAYRDGAQAGADFDYVRGTRLPPELVGSMRDAALGREQLPNEERAAIFYGPGLEWLERIWPARKVPGLPLWMHGGTSYGTREEAKLLSLLRGDPRTFDLLWVTEARDHWGVALDEELRRAFVRERMGPTWVRYRGLPAGVVSADPLGFLADFGGNVDSTHLRSVLTPTALADGRRFLALSAGEGVVRMTALAYRVSAEAVVRRRPGSADRLRVRFAATVQHDGGTHERAAIEVELAPGEQEKVVEMRVDPGARPLSFHVAVPVAAADGVDAGWRAWRILHAVDGPEVPPTITSGAFESHRAGSEVAASLLPAGHSVQAVFLRPPVDLRPEGLLLHPGAEVWLRLSGVHPEIDLRVQTSGPLNPAAQPVVRVLYYKGGRIDVERQEALRTAEPMQLRAWSAELDGWIGILLDRNPSVPPVLLRVERISVGG